jgi:hypothetical protein
MTCGRCHVNHYDAKNYLYEIMGERTRRVRLAGKCQLTLFEDDKPETTNEEV